MKKLLVSIAVTTLLLSACSKPDQAKSAESSAETTAPVDTAHTAENSLDWHGKYRGTLPCADCSGIETAIQLNKNKTYEINETYLGKGQGKGQNFVEKGSFNFDNSNPSIIVLDQKADGRKYFVAENQLYALDSFGEKITGDFEEMYILKKDAS